jgi:hypothetical protein
VIRTLLIGLLIASPALAQDVVVVAPGGANVTEGMTWSLPNDIDLATSAVAVFSQSPDTFSIRNKGAQPITIEGIELARGEGVVDEEFAIRDPRNRDRALDLAGQTVAPNAATDFSVLFFPVHAGVRQARVTVRFSGGRALSWTVQGRGRPAEAVFLREATTTSHHVLGGRDTDALVSGMVADAAGNAYVLWQEIGLADKFAFDIGLARINADGTRGWSKLWNGRFRDASPDSGQNNETGGTSRSIVMDEQGFVYFVGQTCPFNQNNNFAVLVVKVNPANGEIVWEKVWRPEWPRGNNFLAKHNATGYGLDVSGGRVFVTGTTGAAIGQGEAYVLLLALDAADGSLKAQRALDVAPGYTSRGYCVRADGKGNVYVGGITNGKGLVMKFGDAASEPRLLWTKQLDMGVGSNVNSLDVDADGSLYVGVDRRGATTFISALKLNGDGALQWGKTYVSGAGPRNFNHVVRVVGASVYVGGLIGLGVFDPGGDGLVARLAASSGAHEWSGIYYTGTGPDEVGEQRVKGIAVAGDSLIVVGQTYTGPQNGVRYHGYWYQGPGALEDYAPAITDIQVGTERIITPAAGAVQPATEARSWIDVPATVVLQDAREKHDGKSPDGDVFIMRLKLGQ